eukprot:CAMPEP_0204114500 /NCGR_PEP_ID=MMETSP0361-20130328/4298_1 /ASSEMBLY_ACC=CAM_ASM_000343 /TAXON_ID=268821 /ORGANISM="Scrippsiella Hangoei, Strain SHTV-5" /LENGTH=686 /DNA_ID=CAMNT_0051065049 /DNA_START=200 /DNA_END=2256 /DNA_ORIENTATION=-
MPVGGRAGADLGRLKLQQIQRQLELDDRPPLPPQQPPVGVGRLKLQQIQRQLEADDGASFRPLGSARRASVDDPARAPPPPGAAPPPSLPSARRTFEAAGAALIGALTPRHSEGLLTPRRAEGPLVPRHRVLSEEPLRSFPRDAPAYPGAAPCKSSSSSSSGGCNGGTPSVMPHSARGPRHVQAGGSVGELEDLSVFVNGDDGMNHLKGMGGFGDVAPVRIASNGDGPLVCIVTAGGQLKCCCSVSPHALPWTFPLKVLVSEVAVGSSHTALITNQGGLFEAHGAAMQKWSFQEKCSHRRFCAVACGDAHTMAAALPCNSSRDGSPLGNIGKDDRPRWPGTPCEMFTWGTGKAGQLGLGWPVRNVLVPKPVPGLALVCGPLACGMHHSLVAGVEGCGRDEASLHSFGWTEHGRLGDCPEARVEGRVQALPSRVSLPSQEGTIRLLAAGAQHTVVVTCSGALWSFGSNEFGQLGCASAPSWTRTPQRMELPSHALGHVTRVSCGTTSTIAVTSVGDVLSWGGFALSGKQLRQDHVESAVLAGGFPVLLVRNGQLTAGAARSAAEQRRRQHEEQRRAAAEEAKAKADAAREREGQAVLEAEAEVQRMQMEMIAAAQANILRVAEAEALVERVRRLRAEDEQRTLKLAEQREQERRRELEAQERARQERLLLERLLEEAAAAAARGRAA